jgi:membrane protease YdiL (CAAX protease family)
VKIIKSILFSIMYTAIYFILQVIISLIMLFGWGYSFAMDNLALTIILTSIISFFIYWGIVKLRKQKLSSACSFNGFDYRQVPILLAAGFFLQYLFQGLILILHLEEIFPEHKRVIKFLFEGGSPLMIILAIVLLGPFIEEFIFRGLITNELKEKLPYALVIFIQALLFGVIHGNWLQISYAFIMGILLGLVTIWSRSVWPAILIHMSMNGTPFLSALLWNKNQIEEFLSDYKVPITITCGFLVMVIMYFIYRKAHADSKVSAIEIPDTGAI